MRNYVMAFGVYENKTSERAYKKNPLNFNDTFQNTRIAIERKWATAAKRCLFALKNFKKKKEI